MKALILAGGRGKRMGQATLQKNKCMTVVAGKPLIQYSLDLACKTNVSEIVILVGYMADEIIKTFGANYGGKPIKYALQNEQRGLVHAIECASPYLEKEDFILMLGDELMIEPHYKEMLEKFSKENLFALCGTVQVQKKELVSKTYSLVEGQDGAIFRLVEKPENPHNNIMGTGNIIFNNQILSFIEKTPINQKRGEKELPDLVQAAIDHGKKVKSFLICKNYLNVNDPLELEKAESTFFHLS